MTYKFTDVGGEESVAVPLDALRVDRRHVAHKLVVKLMDLAEKQRKARIDGGVIRLTEDQARTLHRNLLAAHPCGPPNGIIDDQPIDEAYVKDGPKYRCQLLLGGAFAIRCEDLDEFTDDLLCALEPEAMTEITCHRLFGDDADHR